MRLFIAINFSEDVVEDLINLQLELKDCGAVGNFTKPENLHLTLAFIGEYGNPDDVLDVMDTVSFKLVPLKFEGLQHFRDMYFARIESNPEKMGIKDFTAKRVSLMKSERGKNGMIYTEIGGIGDD